MSRAVPNTSPPEPVTEIRITDPYIHSLVSEEQRRTGERSMARTAARLITERLAIREVMPEPAAAPA